MTGPGSTPTGADAAEAAPAAVPAAAPATPAVPAVPGDLPETLPDTRLKLDQIRAELSNLQNTVDERAGQNLMALLEKELDEAGIIDPKKRKEIIEGFQVQLALHSNNLHAIETYVTDVEGQLAKSSEGPMEKIQRVLSALPIAGIIVSFLSDKAKDPETPKTDAWIYGWVASLFGAKDTAGAAQDGARAAGEAEPTAEAAAGTGQAPEAQAAQAEALPAEADDFLTAFGLKNADGKVSPEVQADWKAIKDIPDIKKHVTAAAQPASWTQKFYRAADGKLAAGDKLAPKLRDTRVEAFGGKLEPFIAAVTSLANPASVKIREALDKLQVGNDQSADAAIQHLNS